MLMLDSIGAGNAHHSAGKFPIFAIFIREFRSIKGNADFCIAFAVIAPIKLGMSSVNHKAEVDWYIIYWDTGIDEFCLFTVFQLDDGNRALSQCFTIVFPQIDIIHVVIV